MMPHGGIMPSLLTRLGQLIPGFTPRPTPPALVVESPEQRRDRVIAEAKQALDRSRGRPAPSVDEKVPQSYFAGVGGKVWFLPYHSSATADTPEIRAAMRLMIRDAYVKAAWEPLCIAVESEEWQIQPSESGNPDAEEQAEFVTTNFNDYLKGGVSALVRAIIGQLGPDGFGLAEKVWAVAAKGRLEGKIVLEAAKAKDPDNLHVKGDAFGNVTHVTSTRKQGEEYPITDFLYSRYPGFFDEPLGMAAFRASYAAYWMRDTVRKLRIMHHEKKMAGFLVGTYATDDEKAPLEAALRAAKSSTWAAVPEGVRFEAVNLSTATEPDYKSFDESLRDEIVTGITFATLQMMTASAPGEMRGDAAEQSQTSDLAKWRLMSIALQVVNEQLIPDLIDFNFPYPAAGGYPKLSFGAISKAEIIEDQQVVQAAQQMGLQPSKKHYAKAWSVQLADPNDPDDQMQAGGPQMPPGGGGGFGGMGGDPFGGGQPDPFAFSEAWESFAWQPAKSRTGGVKAVGTAEDAGRFLYGRQAEAALARQGRTDRGEAHPELPQEKAKRLAAEREPARAEARQAFAKALEAPDKITPDELAGLGERMKSLTRDELRGFARNMAARAGGLKPELVERLVAKARERVGLPPAIVEAATAPPSTGPKLGFGNRPAVAAFDRNASGAEPQKAAAALKPGDRVTIDGQPVEVLSVRTQTRRAPLAHPTDPGSLWQGEQRTPITTVRARNSWLQETTLTVRGETDRDAPPAPTPKPAGPPLADAVATLKPTDLESIEDYRAKFPHLSDGQFRDEMMNLARAGKVKLSFDRAVDRVPDGQRGFTPVSGGLAAVGVSGVAPPKEKK